MQKSGYSTCLHRDDVMSLLRHHHLVSQMHIQVLNASKLIDEVVEKNDRIVREWRATFLTNNNSFPNTLQGKYQRRGVLWSDEKLNNSVRKYVHENANIKAKANMTSVSFCKWVNEELLPNWVLEPGYLRKIGLEAVRKCLHHLEFHLLDHKEGIYINGHERDDIIEYCQNFLCKMVSIGFLNKDNAPTVEATQFLPDVFVIGKNFTEHLDNLREVFDTFHTTNLKLKPGKCSLEVVYLGYVVSMADISADPQKVEVVNNFPQPHDITSHDNSSLSDLSQPLSIVPSDDDTASSTSDITVPRKMAKENSQSEISKYF